MAERRMFAKSIVLSDAFLDMPMSARCLYFTLGMFADDDGFVGGPKSVMRQCGASQDDLLILLQKRYVLAFKSGVIVIKHWRMNNYLQSDRKKKTTYLEELGELTIDDKGAYTEAQKDDMYTECIQDVYTGKNSIGKDSINILSKDNICPALSSKEVEQYEQYANVEELPCTNNEIWKCTEDFYQECKRLYPDVNIEQEFRSMRGWLNANSKKTKRGMKRFVNNWLSRSQNRNVKKQDNNKSSLDDWV